jgi:hypothetical protein
MKPSKSGAAFEDRDMVVVYHAGSAAKPRGRGEHRLSANARDHGARCVPGARSRATLGAMAILGVTRVRCPACDREAECQLVQSINTRADTAAKVRLLAGELNVLTCPCGRRTQLSATVLFHDPDASYWCQVCPGGERALAEGEAAFRVAGASGTQRLVPSLNALVEKVKLLDAGLDDWAIEMVKVLLLASREDRDLERVLLFDRVDPDHNTIDWVLFEDAGARPMTSPLGVYTKLAGRVQGRPASLELRIDRAWAIDAVRTMIADAN